MEVQIGMIAKGQADKDAVVAHALQQFRQKFLFFVAKVARMDALFEASFSPLASSGSRPLPSPPLPPPLSLYVTLQPTSYSPVFSSSISCNTASSSLQYLSQPQDLLMSNFS